MALDSVYRNVKYEGDGSTTAFPFAFTVFATTDIALYTLDESGYASEEISTDSYSVQLADEGGGTVTFYAAPAAGYVFSIVSEIPSTQPMNLTPYDGMNPEVLNDSADRTVALIQQLEERADRALEVPAASDKTPDELMEELLSAQEDAQQSADQAQQAADEAVSARDEILGEQSTVISKITEEGGKQVDRIQAEGEEQVDRIQAEGEEQADRLQGITDQTLVGYGVGGRQETWTLEADVAAGETITLPNDMTYIVGRNHFRLSWNGLVLYKDENFSEVGTIDQPSAVFTVSFDLKTGDVLNAWAVPLGRGNLGNFESEFEAVVKSVDDIYSRAAFHDLPNTTTED